jgi:glycosyltransferase involved in cell wall biosynthesis
MDDITDEDQLLFVGRLKKSKGVHKLIRAFGNLTNFKRSLTLKIVGDGPQKVELKKLTKRLNLTSQVNFIGELHNEELPKIYNESTLFVLPTEAEGLPRSILESLACGTPVVTSDLPQLQELVEGVGLYVPLHQEDALAKAIKTLLTDQERLQRMANRARQQVVNDYPWSETVKKTTRVYYKVLEEQSS